MLAADVTDEPLTPQSVREIVKRAAEVLDIEGASGHSLRIGSAQSLAERSAPWWRCSTPGAEPVRGCRHYISRSFHGPSNRIH